MRLGFATQGFLGLNRAMTAKPIQVVYSATIEGFLRVEQGTGDDRGGLGGSSAFDRWIRVS